MSEASKIDRKKESTLNNRSTNSCEPQWTEIQTKSKSIILGSYFRPPNSNIKSLFELKSSVTNVTKNGQEKPLFLAGDFNLLHIDRENNTIIPGGQSAHSQELLELSEEFGIEQIQMNTTRENNNLDLFFYKPSNLSQIL